MSKFINPLGRVIAQQCDGELVLLNNTNRVCCVNTHGFVEADVAIDVSLKAFIRNSQS